MNTTRRTYAMPKPMREKLTGALGDERAAEVARLLDVLPGAVLRASAVGLQTVLTITGPAEGVGSTVRARLRDAGFLENGAGGWSLTVQAGAEGVRRRPERATLDMAGQTGREGPDPERTIVKR